MVRALHKKCTVIHAISELVLRYKQPKIIPQRNEYITAVKLVCDIAKIIAEIITANFAPYSQNPPKINPRKAVSSIIAGISTIAI